MNRSYCGGKPRETTERQQVNLLPSEIVGIMVARRTVAGRKYRESLSDSAVKTNAQNSWFDPTDKEDTMQPISPDIRRNYWKPCVNLDDKFAKLGTVF